MCRLRYLLIFICLFCFSCVYGSENSTFTDIPVHTLVNLTGNNELWTILLKDCQKPTLACVQNNIFSYLKRTLDETDDLQFTSFLKFTKNKLDYGRIQRSFDIESNDTSEEFFDDEFPIESMSRSLKENTAKFFMTHDLQVSLPDGIFPNSVLKIAPRGLENHGTLLNLEIVSNDLEAARGLDTDRTFKKIRKFINERLIYALLAILLIVKLLAVKFLFLLPLLVGAATAKKLLLKILLFVFPFLHHIFKFCAYYPIQAKYHHHKHLISHIHQVAPHHDHHEGVEVIGPHGYGPPPIGHHGDHEEHFTELDDDVSVFPDDGSGFPHGLISHRKDPNHENDISSYGHTYNNRRRPNRPGSTSDIHRVVAKAEKEAIIKARLEKERIRIREENLKLQEQLNQAIKLQEKLRQQAAYFNKKIPPTKISPSFPYNHKPGGIIINQPHVNGPPFDISKPTVADGPGIELPAGYIPQHTVPQRPQISQPVEQNIFAQKPQSVQQNHFEQQYQASLQTKFDQQYQPSQINSQTQLSQSLSSHGPIYKPQVSTAQLTNSGINQNKFISSAEVDVQQSVEYDPRNGVFDNSKEVPVTGNEFVRYQKPVETFEKPSSVNKPVSSPKPKLELEISQAASITYDKFYSPILQKIDKILQELGFNDEPCRERLICSMYKHPTQFSPHSNLLSAQLSRDSSELQKPSSTNSAVIRFYKYVQAARDGQDQRDCLRLYPSCPINTEVS